MKIDSHQHFWNYDPAKDSWITDEMSVLKKDFSPSMLHGILRSSDFDGCVTVQSQQNEAHNAFLLQCAEKYSFIKGIVGWVDLQSMDLDKKLERYSSFSKMKGFRHVIQSEALGFMTAPLFVNGVNTLAKYHYTYDLLIKSNQLSEAVSFVRQINETKIVINHLAKPDIRNNEFEHWYKYMRLISKSENVFCKVSGMVTEANWHSWKKADFYPYLDSIMEMFGPDRLLYGSDWPVCLLAASYEEQLAVTYDYFSQFSQEECQKIFGLNAQRFYRIES